MLSLVTQKQFPNLFPTVLGGLAFTEGLDFLRQPTGQSKRTCGANHTLCHLLEQGLPFQEGVPDRSFNLLVPSVPHKAPSFQLLQLPSKNGFSCPSPQQAKTSGPKPRPSGHSTNGWLLSPSSSRHPPFYFSVESPRPPGLQDSPFILQPPGFCPGSRCAS